MVGGNLPQSPLLRLSIEPEHRIARPGERAEFVITIENTGTASQRHNVELAGLPDAWYRIAYDAAESAAPGETRIGGLTISVPENIGSGRYDFDVSVFSGPDESSVSASIEVTSSLAEPPEFDEPDLVEKTAQSDSAESSNIERPVVSIESGAILWRGGDQAPVRKVLSVRNTGKVEADYVLEVEGLEPAWFTLLNRVRVGPGQELQSDLSVHPPAGARAQDYPFSILVGGERTSERVEVRAWLSVQGAGVEGLAASAPPTQPQSPPEPYIPPVTASGERITPPDVSLAPKTNFQFSQTEPLAQALITVANPGRTRERYSLEVSGIPEEWYRLSDLGVRLDPGESRQVTLRLSPETGPGLPAGEYEFRIRAVPDGMPDYYGEALGRLSIAGIARYEARLEPLQAQGLKKVFHIRVENVGDMPLKIAVSASDSENRCKFQVPAPRDIHPGQIGLLPVKVGARRWGVVGPPETFDFRLKLTDEANSGQTARDLFDARFIHRPRLSHRSVFVTGFMCALIGLVFLLIWMLTPVVEDGANWVGCQLDSDYRLAADASFKKESCGGEPYDQVLDNWIREQRTGSVVAPVSDRQSLLTLTASSRYVESPHQAGD